MIHSGKKLHSEPKQKLANLIRLRKVTLEHCISLLLLCNILPQLSSLKEHSFLSSHFCSSWVQWGMAGFLHLGSHKGEIKGQQGSIPLWRLWGRIFQVHSGRWQYSVLYWLSARVFSQLLKAACFPSRVPHLSSIPPSLSSPPHASNLCLSPVLRFMWLDQAHWKSFPILQTTLL